MRAFQVTKKLDPHYTFVPCYYITLRFNSLVCILFKNSSGPSPEFLKSRDGTPWDRDRFPGGLFYQIPNSVPGKELFVIKSGTGMALFSIFGNLQSLF